MMFSRFALRLMLLYVLLCMVLTVVSIVIGHSAPYEASFAMGFSEDIPGCYQMDTRRNLGIRVDDLLIEPETGRISVPSLYCR